MLLVLQGSTGWALTGWRGCHHQGLTATTTTLPQEQLQQRVQQQAVMRQTLPCASSSSRWAVRMVVRRGSTGIRPSSWVTAGAARACPYTICMHQTALRRVRHCPHHQGPQCAASLLQQQLQPQQPLPVLLVVVVRLVLVLRTLVLVRVLVVRALVKVNQGAALVRCHSLHQEWG